MSNVLSSDHGEEAEEGDNSMQLDDSIEQPSETQPADIDETAAASQPRRYEVFSLLVLFVCSRFAMGEGFLQNID